MLENIFLASAIFFAGILSGLLGIGGGVLFVPIFVYIFKMNMHQAIGTSVALIIPTVIFASFVHISSGNIAFKIVLSFFVFSIIGGLFGAYLSNYLPAILLKKIFAVFLLFVAIKMLIK